MPGITPVEPVIVAQGSTHIKKEQGAQQKMQWCEMDEKNGKPEFRCSVNEYIMGDEQQGNDPQGSRQVKRMWLYPPVVKQMQGSQENYQQCDDQWHGNQRNYPCWFSWYENVPIMFYEAGGYFLWIINYSRNLPKLYLRVQKGE
jgi:hypothetical protein